MDIELKTAQLLVSRICHDLAGGISALSTGAELLAEDSGAADADALALISSSAQQSSHRLKFLRVAFGSDGGDGDSVSMADLRKLTQGFLEGGRVSLAWEDDGQRIALGSAKLLLNLCLIGAEALPRGGVLSISGGQMDGQLGFGVSAQGAGARIAGELRSAMVVDIDAEKLTARTVHGHFTAVLAEKLRAQLEVQSEEGQDVRLAALIPLG